MSRDWRDMAKSGSFIVLPEFYFITEHLTDDEIYNLKCAMTEYVKQHYTDQPYSYEEDFMHYIDKLPKGMKGPAMLYTDLIDKDYKRRMTQWP